MANRDTNDNIRRKGGYDKALHAMKKLSSVGLLDCLVTTMTKYNIHQMAHTAALAEAIQSPLSRLPQPCPRRQSRRTTWKT